MLHPNCRPRLFVDTWVVWILEDAIFKSRLGSELKANNTRNMTETLKLVLEIAKNIVGKGENAGCRHFLLYPQRFQKVSNTGSLKVVVVWLTHSHTMTPFDAHGKQAF